VSINPLERAIALVKQGKPIEAQKLLKPLIAADHHNLSAWFWFVESCSTNKQRINVLEICLEYNPANEQIKQALDKLKALPIQQLSEQSSNAENKIIPKNIYTEEAKSSTIKILKSKKSYPQDIFNFLRLIGLSIISGLSIAYITSAAFQLAKGTDIVGLFIIMVCTAVQYLLVIPFTFAVYKVESWMSSSVNVFVRAGIPLIFNLLGASVLPIEQSIHDAPKIQSDALRSSFLQNATITITNETVINDDSINVDSPLYQANLHIRNSLQNEIPGIHFYLGAYKIDTYEQWNRDHPYEPFAEYGGDAIGSSTYYSIPPGETDIVINVEFWRGSFVCNNTSLTKPLYLLYSTDRESRPIAVVSNGINQKMQKIACASTP
jgi:hypothetical protein